MPATDLDVPRDPMLYLLKGSRVAEYRRENIAILGAPEGSPFSVSYSRRWVQDELTIAPGDGATIVFSDTPYRKFVPIRFCVIDEVVDEPGKVVVAGRLGPFIHPDASGLLTARWAERTGNNRPGLRFLFTDENPGLYSPNTLDEHDDAWRAAVDGLGDNGYFAQLTAARVTRITDAEGVARLPSERFEVGETLAIDLELRTPTHDIDEVEAVLDVDPRGSAELVDTHPLPATGTGTAHIRILAPGELSTRLAFNPEPLHSSRLTLRLDAEAPSAIESPTANRPTSADSQATGLDLQALLNHLSRYAALDADAWVHLHEDVLLRGRPDDPSLLGDYAQHCYDAAAYAKAHGALSRLSERTPEQSTLLLLSALRSGREADLDLLLHTSDFSSDRVFHEFLDAVKGTPPATVNRLLRLLVDDLLADEKLIAAAQAAWSKVSSVDIACEVADQVAYLDPDAGAMLLFEKWPNAAAMPDRPIGLLLDWGVHRDRLGPYAECRLDRAADAGDWAAVVDLVTKLRELPGADEEPQILSTAGRYLLTADGEWAARGFETLCDATTTACRLGQIDLAVSNLGPLRAYAEQGTADERAGSVAVESVVEAAIEGSETLRRWEEMRAATAFDQLRPRCNGRNLHAVGGKRADWMDEVSDGLGLADFVWHETEKGGSNHADWVSGLGDKDIVVVMTDHIGHAISGPVRDQCKRAKVPCLFATTSIQSLQEALENLDR